MEKVANSRCDLICIVDDDSSVRGAFRFLLRTHGFEVMDFDGPLAVLGSDKIDRCACFVIDMHTPDLTGLELLRTLRRRKVSAPVIIVTGREDPLLCQQALAAGAVALLAKPVASDVLVSTIKKAIAPNTRTSS